MTAIFFLTLPKRNRFGIEAAVGTFLPKPGQAESDAAGGCIRLSHAVYNEPSEYVALRDAVLELLEESKSEK